VGMTGKCIAISVDGMIMEYRPSLAQIEA